MKYPTGKKLDSAKRKELTGRHNRRTGKQQLRDIVAEQIAATTPAEAVSMSNNHEGLSSRELTILGIADAETYDQYSSTEELLDAVALLSQPLTDEEREQLHNTLFNMEYAEQLRAEIKNGLIYDNVVEQHGHDPLLVV